MRLALDEQCGDSQDCFTTLSSSAQFDVIATLRCVRSDRVRRPEASCGEPRLSQHILMSSRTASGRVTRCSSRLLGVNWAAGGRSDRATKSAPGTIKHMTIEPTVDTYIQRTYAGCSQTRS